MTTQHGRQCCLFQKQFLQRHLRKENETGTELSTHATEHQRTRHGGSREKSMEGLQNADLNYHYQLMKWY